MSEKPLLNGNRARAIFGELADVATQVVNRAADALLASHQNNESAVEKIVADVLRDAMTVQRVLTLLEAGKIDEAEALITRKAK